MFKELAPYLRQRAVLLTVTHLEEDQIRVNVVPQKLKDGENTALTTPVSITGTAEELDRDLPGTLVNFVAAHLQLKNTLDRATEEMDLAAKAAKAEAASAKTKAVGVKKDAPKPSTARPDAKPEAAAQPKPELPKTASLFEVPQEQTALPGVDRVDEEEEILAEMDENHEDDEEFGKAA